MYYIVSAKTGKLLTGGMSHARMLKVLKNRLADGTVHKLDKVIAIGYHSVSPTEKKPFRNLIGRAGVVAEGRGE